MANKSSAKKMIRKIKVRTERNKMWRSRYKTYVREVEQAIESGDKSKAQVALRAAQPIMHRAASRGIWHIRKVSRKISRLSAKIKGMSGEFIVG